MFFFFQNNSGLKALRMTGNKIENRGGMFFAQMLQVNTTLEALDLGDTDLVSVKPSKGLLMQFAFVT